MTKQALDQAVIEAKSRCLTELETLLERAAEVEDELAYASLREDELAAHVERLSKAALDAIHYLPGGEIKAELRDAYDDTPATSLARRDLIKQAEVLDRVINVMRQPMTDGGHPWLVRVEDIQAMAEDLRKQAKDLEKSL